jgi:prepilin-type N-terminal cleavage/methylation domain-containing protein
MLRSRRGFSLIEIMIVVAILGVLAGLSVAAYGRIGAASAPRNAINDLSSSLLRARTMAVENQSDVYFIVYPTSTAAGVTATSAGGHGAYFLYEDKAGTFNLAASTTSTSVYYRTGTGGVAFVPSLAFVSGTTFAEGRVIDKTYLDDYAGKNVVFDKPTGLAMTASEAPFSGLTLGSACTFCTGDPLRGAIVFSGDGTARFINGDGDPVAATGTTSVSRAHALTLMNLTQTRVYVVAVSGPTAFIGTYDRKL